MNQFTIDELKSLVPKAIKNSVTDEIVNAVNEALVNDEATEAFRENMLSYINVMLDGKYKLSSYISAVKYVSYKLLGHSNTSAYKCTFPDKWLKLHQNGTSAKDISAYVAAYNKGKLVNAIFAQTIVPSYVLNAHLYQDALNVQADIMNNESVNPRDRVAAANSILVNLKPPEVTKVQLDVGVHVDDRLKDLRTTMAELAALQRKNIELGVSTVVEVAQSSIIVEGEFSEVM
jgi:hypothetical protein